MKDELLKAGYSIWEVALPVNGTVLFNCTLYPTNGDGLEFHGNSHVEVLEKAHSYIFHPNKDPMRFHNTQPVDNKSWWRKLFNCKKERGV